MLFLMANGLVACGGGNSGSMNPGPPATDPWQSVVSALDNDSIADLALIVGDASGEVFRYEKGGFSVVGEYPIASASKWLTSATVLALIEQGLMSLDDRPQQYLSFWSDDPQDPRSRITLEQLLSFTAGFHRGPGNAGCIGGEAYSILSCVEELHAQGVDAEPGTTYFYGPTHMQVAAAMAEVTTGQSWSEVVRLTLVEDLRLSAATGFSGNNPRASGSAVSSAVDYAEFLRAQLAGEFLGNSLDTLIAERLSNVTVVSRPATVDDNGVDWYYGLGVWRECDQSAWDENCANSRRVSSPGLFGWYPWLDLDLGYYAVLAMEERATLFSTPSAESVALGNRLRPLIERALLQ